MSAELPNRLAPVLVLALVLAAGPSAAGEPAATRGAVTNLPLPRFVSSAGSGG